MAFKGAFTIGQQISEILDEYGAAFTRDVERTMQQVAKESVEKLKANSPSGRDGYARNWTYKREQSRKTNGLPVFTVHNKGTYSITHLLENSHLIINGKGQYGRTSPGRGQVIHIAPVEEWANDELERRIREALVK